MSERQALLQLTRRMRNEAERSADVVLSAVVLLWVQEIETVLGVEFTYAGNESIYKPREARAVPPLDLIRKVRDGAFATAEATIGSTVDQELFAAGFVDACNQILELLADPALPQDQP